MYLYYIYIIYIMYIEIYSENTKKNSNRVTSYIYISSLSSSPTNLIPM